MRKSVLAGIFACAVVFTLQTEKSSAASLELLQNTSEPSAIAILDDVAGLEQTTLEEKEPADPVIETTVVEHTISEGESLSTIAKAYGTTWQRLFDKNTDIEHPDVVRVGLKIVIPAADETLEARPLPIVEIESVRQDTTAANGSRNTSAVNSVVASNVPADTSGNRYVKGYCTWYVKNRRPDLPNNLGNAATWASRAAAQGYATGSTPVVGAVGQQGNHVVYVESVNGDGTVTISEMNWEGWNITSTRTVTASSFIYIY